MQQKMGTELNSHAVSVSTIHTAYYEVIFMYFIATHAAAACSARKISRLMDDRRYPENMDAGYRRMEIPQM